MKSLTTLLAFFSILNLCGQNQIGLFCGLSSMNTNSDRIFKDSESRKSFNTGLVFEHSINGRFGYAAGLSYSQRGFRLNTEFTDNEANIIASGESAFNYDYLMIPLLASVSAGKRLKGTFKIGLAPAILLDARTITSAINAFPGETIDVTDRVTPIDLSGVLRVESSYDLDPNFVAFISLNYLFGANHFTNEDYFSSEEASHMGTMIDLGLKYRLGSNKEPK